MNSTNDQTNWHTLTTQNSLNVLSSSLKGLSNSEAKKALAIFGENQLPEAKSASIIMLFLRQFKEIMIIILLIAVVISGVLGEFTDPLIILIILILNATLSAYQERRAQQALLL